MTLRERIIAIAEAYSNANGRGRKRVSTLVFGRGSKLDDVANGGDLTTRSYEGAMQWFSDNWPAGVDWPSEIPRPAPQIREAAE